MTPEQDDPLATADGRIAALAASLYYTLEVERDDRGVHYDALTPAYRAYLEAIVGQALLTAARWRFVRYEAPAPPPAPARPVRALTLVPRHDGGDEP